MDATDTEPDAELLLERVCVPGTIVLTLANFPGRVVLGAVGTALQYSLDVDRIQWLRKTHGTHTEGRESA
jgi:hypothetical protein